MSYKNTDNDDEKRGWWYFAEVHQFGGFVFGDAQEVYAENDMNPWGPFDTFTEAKNDAIDYFRIDKIEAERCIAEIKACKKPKTT